MADADTICAISTPTGEGGIGIIRISGTDSHRIGKKIFKAGKISGTFESRKLYLGYIVDPVNRKRLDEVFLVFMSAPHTYTRENIIEIYSHGGYAAQTSILSLIINCGARLAEPGEFTKRAFLNGRIDLLQAEAVLDIIRSETDEELQQALKYLQGKLSRKINGFSETLKHVLASSEALIDFPEEEVGVSLDDLVPRLKETESDIRRLVDSYYEGRGIKEGFEVLIAGRTNVGKSSLLNSLLLKERAIVTAFPGTTRDLIEETIYLKGLKANIIDTAGIRTSENPIEQEGIRRVRDRITEVDLVIWVLDGSQPYSADDDEVFRTIGTRLYLPVLNKSDLPRVLKTETVPVKETQFLEVSAVADMNIDKLRDRIYSLLTGGRRRHNSLLITSARHRNALLKAQECIHRAVGLVETREPLELIAFELREGLHHLAEITGETCSEEILEDIFHRFCIGK